MPTLEDLIGIHAMKMARHQTSIYLAPKIPEKKLAKAIDAYGESVDPTRVIALYDSTFMGSATDGFFITPAGIYFSEGVEGEAGAIMFHDIHRALLAGEELLVELGEGERKVKLSNSFVDHKPFLDFVRAMLEARAEGLVHEVDRFVILEDMSDAVKLAYINVIIQMIYVDDGHIDQRELAELHTLMAQLDFSPELRANVRTLIADAALVSEGLLEELDHALPLGSHASVHLSLLKDLIRIHRATEEEGPGAQAPFILGVAQQLEVSTEQLEMLESACQFDEDIFEGKLDDDQIRKGAADLAAAAGAVGVPLAAVYLSGSVVGLSAAGITSGLAALGLGGVMGLGAMVTGLGVVIIIGGGVFAGVRWVLRSDDSSRRYALRETMLTEVLYMNQRTTDSLLEDINYLHERLREEVEASSLNHQRISALARELSIFGQAMSVLQGKGGDIFDELKGTDVRR